MSIDVYAILYPPFVSIRLSNSQQGLSPSTPKALFGTVDAVNYANMRTNVGNSVLFNSEDAVIITQSSNTFYLVREDDIILKEKVPT